MMYATIDSFGIHTPTYDDVLEELKENYRTIYGEDTYLEADSQDGQFVAVLALAIKDANDMAVMTYNAFSPTTAVGNGLSSVVKVNGIRRLVASYSTVLVTLTGVAGTVITDGAVIDNFISQTWLLPPTVTITNTGEVTVTATAQTPGAHYVSIGTVDRILTNTPGWQEVTNPATSIPGAPIEIDADLRRRQALSTAYPAETVRESIYAGIANIVGVQRLKVYENWSGEPDEHGIPGHSIAVVAEGGDVVEIATSVAYRKPPGTGTYGDITQTIIDSHGVPNTINLFELINVRIKVLVIILPLEGYITSTADVIKTAVAYWLTNQEVGTGSYYSRLIPPIELSGTAATEVTGRTQNELNQLSKTYIAVSVAQAAPDMIVTGGPYVTDAIAVSMLALNNISKGDTCYLTMDNGVFWKVVITDVIGDVIYFDDYPIPDDRSVLADALVYLSDDLDIGFTAATLCQVTDVSILIDDGTTEEVPPSEAGERSVIIVATGSLVIPVGFNGTVMVKQTAPATITLPTSPVLGQQITIKDALGKAELYNITIAGIIEEQTNTTINFNYNWVTVMYAGTQWVQI